MASSLRGHPHVPCLPTVTAVMTGTILVLVLRIPLLCLPFSEVHTGAMYTVHLPLLHPISKAGNEAMQHKKAYILKEQYSFI